MHHALEIQEILANIFRHLRGYNRVNLASLARTCRTFKEPALDVLWKNVEGLTPLARCLPEASEQLAEYKVRFRKRSNLSTVQYSLHRPLTPTEWDTLRRYARRIQVIRGSNRELDEKSLSILSNTTESLFPNLRELYCKFHAAMLLLHHPLPSLHLVRFDFRTIYSHPNASSFNDSLQVFSQLCPNVRWAHFDLSRHIQPPSTKAISDCICGWRTLLDVLCSDIPLDAAAIVHLSRRRRLARLQLALDDTLPHFDSPLVFSRLGDFSLLSRSWSSVSQFLSRVQLPATRELTVMVTSRHPSPVELSSFFESVRMSGASSTLNELKVEQSWCMRRPDVLSLDDLRPCMGFSNLIHIELDIPWDVGLTDGDLLVLTPAWPCLKCLCINPSWGWNTTSGITPNGLLQLLQTCPSLKKMALAVDTRDFNAFAPPPESVGAFSLDVLDSIIEEDSISPFAAFLAHVAGHPDFKLFFGFCPRANRRQDRGVYERRWNEVKAKAKDLVSGNPQIANV